MPKVTQLWDEGLISKSPDFSLMAHALRQLPQVNPQVSTHPRGLFLLFNQSINVLFHWWKTQMPCTFSLWHNDVFSPCRISVPLNTTLLLCFPWMPTWNTAELLLTPWILDLRLQVTWVSQLPHKYFLVSTRLEILRQESLSECSVWSLLLFWVGGKQSL